jgi:hypothetical protein
MTYQVNPLAIAHITEVGLSLDVSGFTSGDTVTLNTTTHSHTGSGRVSLSSNVVTLTAGTYIIYGAVAIDKTTVTDAYTVDFYDDATSTKLPISDGWMGSQSAELYSSNSQLLQAHLELTSSISFYLVSTGASGTLKADGVYLMILEL